jgi:hypothetical protein
MLNEPDRSPLVLPKSLSRRFDQRQVGGVQLEFLEAALPEVLHGAIT